VKLFGEIGDKTFADDFLKFFDMPVEKNVTSAFLKPENNVKYGVLSNVGARQIADN